MRILPIASAFAAVLATSIAAYAADTTTTGKIKSFDMKAHTLTLSDGTTYLEWETPDRFGELLLGRRRIEFDGTGTFTG